MEYRPANEEAGQREASPVNTRHTGGEPGETPMVTIELDRPSTVTIVRTAAHEERDQGLVLASDEPLSVGDVSADRVVLWSHTAPDTVTVEATAGPLHSWNAWRSNGIEHAWVGWAGIRAREDTDEEGTDRLVLRCSDGEDCHPTDAIDLEVQLSITPNPAAAGQ